jgi:hypothetical protein
MVLSSKRMAKGTTYTEDQAGPAGDSLLLMYCLSLLQVPCALHKADTYREGHDPSIGARL